MTISQKLADILWSAAQKYLASLTEEERNQILSRAENKCILPAPFTEQSTSSTNS